MELSSPIIVTLILTQFIIIAGIFLTLNQLRQIKKQVSQYDTQYDTQSQTTDKNSTEDIRSRLINDIQNGNYPGLSNLDELQELTNFDGAVPTISAIEVNLVELIISYRREILHETNRNVSVSIRTGMSAHTKATLDTIIFRQLIMHLLRICVQRTPIGQITIFYEWENEGLRFKIEDSGKALSSECYPLLFTDRLTQDMINTDVKITQNNLRISKSIIDSLQGTIEALPGNGGRGLVFSFWIPCRIRIN